MILILQIIIGVIGFFFLTFLEVLFLILFNFRFCFPFFLLAKRRVDWKLLLVVSTILSLIFDVVLHYKLGTNLLLFGIPSGILLLLSFIFSIDEDGIPMYIATFFASLSYYVANQLLPSVFTTGVFGFVDVKILLFIILKSIVTTVIVWLGEILVCRLRDRGNSRQIRLK